jgi:hypothetical protein
MADAAAGGAAGGVGVGAGVGDVLGLEGLATAVCLEVPALEGPSGTPLEQPATSIGPKALTSPRILMQIVLMLTTSTSHRDASGMRNPAEKMPAWNPLLARYRSYCSVRPVPRGIHHTCPFGVIVTFPV